MLKVSVVAVAVLMAGTSLASATDLKQGQDQGQLQGQGQLQAQGQVAKSRASSRAGAVSGSAALSGSSSAGGASTNEGDDINAYGFAYSDSAIAVPQGVVGGNVVITSQNLKVLGPLFGYSWQDTSLTPQGIHEKAALGYLATTNDGTYDGERAQFSYIAAICASDEDFAYQLGFGCRE